MRNGRQWCFLVFVCIEIRDETPTKYNWEYNLTE